MGDSLLWPGDTAEALSLSAGGIVAAAAAAAAEPADEVTVVAVVDGNVAAVASCSATDPGLFPLLEPHLQRSICEVMYCAEQVLADDPEDLTAENPAVSAAAVAAVLVCFLQTVSASGDSVADIASQC